MRGSIPRIQQWKYPLPWRRGLKHEHGIWRNRLLLVHLLNFSRVSIIWSLTITFVLIIDAVKVRHSFFEIERVVRYGAAAISSAAIRAHVERIVDISVAILDYWLIRRKIVRSTRCILFGAGSVSWSDTGGGSLRVVAGVRGYGVRRPTEQGPPRTSGTSTVATGAFSSSTSARTRSARILTRSAGAIAGSAGAITGSAGA
jgi:hypothetical protein